MRYYGRCRGAEVAALPFISNLAAHPRRVEDVGETEDQPRSWGSPGAGGGVESLPAQSSWVRVCPGTSDVGSVR